MVAVVTSPLAASQKRQAEIARRQMTGGSNERPVPMKRRKHGTFVSMRAQRRIEIRALACHLVESNQRVRDAGREGTSTAKRTAGG